MNISMEQLRYKEVVSLADGTRFGYVGDLEVDTDLGQVTALIIPGRPRLLGLLGREPDRSHTSQARPVAKNHSTRRRTGRPRISSSARL